MKESGPDCPNCGNVTEVIYEQFGRNFRKVAPTRCRNCGWNEKMNLEDRVKIAIPLAKVLANHEIDYVNDQSIGALDRFLSEHGYFLTYA